MELKQAQLLKLYIEKQIAYGSYYMKTKPDKVKKKKLKKFHTAQIITKLIETCNFLFKLSQIWRTTTSNYICIPIITCYIVR